MTMKLGVQEEPAIYKVLLGLANAVPLARVAEFNPRRHSVPPADADLVSFVPMRAVAEESGHIDSEARRPWSEVKKGYTAFQNGDVIFAKITPCMENGKFALAYALHNGRAAGSTEFHVFRSKPGLLPKYLFHFLFTPYVRRGAKMNMKGAAGQLRVPIQFFEGLRIPLPAPEEQQRVVDYLDEQLSRLDASVAALHRVQANLKRYRASVLKSACEGRLVPIEAELARQEGRDFETGAQLLQRASARRADRRVSPPETKGLLALPEAWALASVDMVGDILLGRQRAPQYLTGESTHCYLRVANIKDDRIDFDDLNKMDFDSSHFAKYQLEPGDILVSEGQSPELLGQSAIFRGCSKPLCFQKTLHRFRAYAGLVTPEFAQLVFRSHLYSGVFRKFGSITTNIGHLTLNRFKAVWFPLPPLAEQHRIVAETDRRLSLIRVAEAQVAANLARAQRLRQSILQAAFRTPAQAGQ